MKRFAIYTASIGGYDDIEQPSVIDEAFDYIVFSDTIPAGKLGVWEVRPVPKKEDISQILLSRYIKTHPHELLSDYEAWIYVDANIYFADRYCYERFAEWFESESKIAALPHPTTDDVYEHIYEMCCFGLEEEGRCMEAMRFLQEQHYPEHHGLNETGILFRKKTEAILKADEQWWWYITHLSRRDQFSFNYVLYAMGIECALLLPQDEPVLKSPHVVYYTHNAVRKRKYAKVKSFGGKMRRFIRKQHPSIYKPFVQQYMRMSRSEQWEMRLRVWGWLMLPWHALNVGFYIKVIKRKLNKKHQSNEKTVINSSARL